MDYTTSTLVKSAMHTTKTADDTLLGTLVTSASRVMDRLLTGRPDAVDYLKSETVSNEYIGGVTDKDGRMRCYPRKPMIASVSALAYRYSPLESWVTASSAYITIESPAVLAWLTFERHRKVQVQISYTGGLATATASLPGDVIEAANILVIRMYQEAQAGYNDVIGVGELGQVFYIKAIPPRATKLLQPFVRSIPSW